MTQHVSAGTAEGAYWLGEPATADPAIVGEAVACLGRLADREFVPPGFCLTAPPLRAGPDGSLVGARVIDRMYGRLVGMSGDPGPAAAIRSALVDTRRPTASWIPEPWAFFNVAGTEAVREAVTECVAPYVSDRAAAYRIARSDLRAEVRLAVVVQQFVAADVCSNVVADRKRMTIRARWGLCELTGGAGWDTLVLRRPDLAVIRRTVADKRRMAVAGAGGVVEVDVPPARRQRPCLDMGQARRLAGLVTAVQARVGGPVEAEVAVAEDRMYLLWCVPGMGGAIPESRS